jgi:hypothetical protein
MNDNCYQSLSDNFMTSCIFLHFKFDQILNLTLTFFDIKDNSTDVLSDLLFSLKQMST